MEPKKKRGRPPSFKKTDKKTLDSLARLNRHHANVARAAAMQAEKDRLQQSIDDAWLSLSESDYDLLDDDTFDPVSQEHKDRSDKHLIETIRDTNNFPFTLKHIFNVELLPYQHVILNELWHRKYPMLIASRGGAKTFMLGVYIMLRLLLCPGFKIVVAGSGLRQSRFVYEYCEKIWNNAPVLRNLVGTDGRNGCHRDIDRYFVNMGDSVANFIPIGDGQSIRGYRANCLICDEFASISEEIYENVLQGFASTTSNPVENVKFKARQKRMKDVGLADVDDDDGAGNQTILSGSAFFDFNHFSKYWKRYKRFVECQNDHKKVSDLFHDGPDPNFQSGHYGVIRIPFDLLPPGLMDETNITRSKATMHTGLFNMEYGAVFTTDSEGFFKRSLIESCTTNKPILAADGPVQFSAELRGNASQQYVYGVDPASEYDNFSVVIVELRDDHRRIVYCWTTTKASHREMLKKGFIKDNDFYGYCARKIRNLMRIFPCLRIAIDAAGGGIAVEEALHDHAKILPGEKPLWRVVNPDKPAPTDDFIGDHILEMVNFSKADWVRDANHGMRKDFEDKVLLFPFFDSVSIAFAAKEDKELSREYDTLEDCVSEIEELKEELTTIVHTQTGPGGRDRWDVPEVKLPGNKKGRLRKDRYSALLMANAVARTMQRNVEVPVTGTMLGGFASQIYIRKDKPVDEYLNPINPAWYSPDVGAYRCIPR